MSTERVKGARELDCNSSNQQSRVVLLNHGAGADCENPKRCACVEKVSASGLAGSNFVGGDGREIGLAKRSRECVGERATGNELVGVISTSTSTPRYIVCGA